MPPVFLKPVEFLIDRRSLPALALLTLLAAGAFAQQTPAASDPAGTPPQVPAYSLKLSTTLITLDVVVTDSKGNPVDTLKKENFSIFEGKTPQAIRAFEPPSAHIFPPDLAINSTAELDRKAPEAAVTVIVLDEANTKFEDEAFARYSIQRYLKTQPETLTQPTELVAIDFTHFKLLRDYTTSKQAILDALNHHLTVNPWQLSAGWETEQFQQSFLALDQVAKAVAGHPGHKNMIWIGHGFPTVDLSSIDNDDLQTIENAVDAATNELRDSRITLYTVDPAGVVVDDGGTDVNGFALQADPFGSSVDFNDMAKATGGKALFGRNDVDNLIGQSVRDGSNFYTLAYRPLDNESPDKYRAIRIALNVPGLTATTRTGYYVKPPAGGTPPKTAKEQMADTSSDLLAASDNQMVYDGLPLEVRNDPATPGRFIVHIPAAGLAWQTQGTGTPAAGLSLLVATFDGKGKLLKRDAKVLTVHNPRANGASDAPQPGVNLGIRMDLTKAARIRFVVRNSNTGKIGSEDLACAGSTCTSAP